MMIVASVGHPVAAAVLCQEREEEDRMMINIRCVSNSSTPVFQYQCRFYLFGSRAPAEAKRSASCIVLGTG